MTTAGGPIPEHDLLDLVEGTLAPEREAVVRAAMARDPRLGQLVARLRADRRGLMSLGAVRAPAGLAERVESALEREALLGLSMGGVGDAIPISGLRPRRAPVIIRAWRSPIGRGLAAAAGLAVLVGGGYLAVTRLSPGLPGGAAPGPGPLATNNDEAHTGAHTDEAAAHPVAAATSDSDPALSGSEPAPDGVESPIAVAIDIHGPAVPSRSDAAAASIAAADSGPAPMSPSRALQLAQRGRLAIVVRAKDPAGAAAGVEALARASEGAGVWQRLDDPTTGAGALARGYETVAALWSPSFGPAMDLIVPEAPGGPGSPAMAATGDGPYAPAERGGPGVGVRLPAWRPTVAPPEAVWTVSVEDREATLASLLSAVARDSLGERAEFVELPTAIDAPPPADPDAVLWWTQPAGAWGWRLNVPVVVEGETSSK